MDDWTTVSKGPVRQQGIRSGASSNPPFVNGRLVVTRMIPEGGDGDRSFTMKCFEAILTFKKLQDQLVR